jgi:hypothetical protein
LYNVGTSHSAGGVSRGGRGAAAQAGQRWSQNAGTSHSAGTVSIGAMGALAAGRGSRGGRGRGSGEPQQAQEGGKVVSQSNEVSGGSQQPGRQQGAGEKGGRRGGRGGGRQGGGRKGQQQQGPPAGDVFDAFGGCCSYDL